MCTNGFSTLESVLKFALPMDKYEVRALYTSVYRLLHFLTALRPNDDVHRLIDYRQLRPMGRRPKDFLDRLFTHRKQSLVGLWCVCPLRVDLRLTRDR